jgi:DNA-binding transcriptional ArsR family regulator
MTLVRHPTLRSWRSYGLLEIHALSYAGSSQALATLQRDGGPFDGVWSVETAPSFQDASWTADQRGAIEEICIRYVRKKDRKRALGFKGSAGLFATDASVPNNLPLILRQAHSEWHPFFERRTVPPDLFTELGSYAPDAVFKDVATRIGQLRLSSNLGAKYMRSATDEMLLMLALLLDRSRSSSELARELGKPLATVDVLLRALQTLGLIDAQREVTSAGKKELTTGKRAPRHVATGIEGSDAPYYPGSMR